MLKKYYICSALIAGTLTSVAGTRPYELDWAGREKDDHPALVDFENLDGWSVECRDSVATFTRSDEQNIWGSFVGKVVYRAEGRNPSFFIKPPSPLKISNDIDAVSLWIYGNNFLARDKSTPSVTIFACFQDKDGKPFDLRIINTRWEQWFLCHRRLSGEQINRVKGGDALFTGFRVAGGRNKEDRTIYFDSFCVFKEKFEALHFKPRAKRGITIFPGRDQGINTGEGMLPFPDRQETVVPAPLTAVQPDISCEGQLLHMHVKGGLDVEIPLNSCQWDGVRCRCNGSEKWIHPAVGGGLFFAGDDDKPVSPGNVRFLDVKIDGPGATCHWTVEYKGREIPVSIKWWLCGQSLVADIAVESGVIQEVHFGCVSGLDNPRLVTLPYYTYGMQVRPAVAVFDAEGKPVFIAQHVDWTLSNASAPFALNETKDGLVSINGGTRYIPKTDGKRNDCYERFVFSMAPDFDAVLPVIPNPVSPWKHVTGRGIWRSHGASNRDSDAAFWREMYRYGLRELIVTDHETGWRDEHESFTFRTKTAPKKGGDKGQYDYARIMQDELGYVYGPYNNFTDFAPVNEYWSSDMISRLPDNQLQSAWARCYAPKPLRAVEYCEKLAPLIEDKFHFSTAYCDVHTAVTPWSRTDYDWRVPGAGTFAQTFYAYGEIMLLQKEAWGGPVYSEGNNHFPYCGLTDGNYAQDQRYNLYENPWLVDFDLLRMHDLCCNFGMGNPGMFFGRETDLGNSPDEIRNTLDRFLAATLAFGHPGFLLRIGGVESSLRSYYMLQQIQERYTQETVKKIMYFDGKKLLDSTAAVDSGAYKRSQLVVEYEGGVNIVVNGNRAGDFAVEWKKHNFVLPPNGYAAWTDDGLIEVYSGMSDGRRIDYCRSPKYIYFDSRGGFARYADAAAAGIVICRLMDNGMAEVIPLHNQECGFAVSAESATALDKAGKEIGVASLRRARRMTCIVPVEGAFSYKLAAGDKHTADDFLYCEFTKVVPGMTVEVKSRDKVNRIVIPSDAHVGKRVWKEIDGQWLDFTLVPLCGIDGEVQENILKVSVTPNATMDDAALTIGGNKFPLEMRVGQLQQFEIPILQENGELLESIKVRVDASGFKQEKYFVVTADSRYRRVGVLPSIAKKGMCLKKNGVEESIRDDSGASVYMYPEMACGDVAREQVLFMHPPYKSGEGYTFTAYDNVELPDSPVALRAFVGKGDGSDLGDGIFFRVEVEEDNKRTVAGSTHVARHEWKLIEADLSAWAGRSVNIRLVADPGQNTSGDWGGWSDIRLEGLAKEMIWSLLPDAEKFLGPSPSPLPGITAEDLKGVKSGVVRYEAIGLAGVHPVYGSIGLFNNQELGNMIPSGGDEKNNIWPKPVEMPLNDAALKLLQMHNVFEVNNPGNDCFKLRNISLEVELADGRKVSSLIHKGVISQPGSWLYAEGAGVPHGENIKVDLWFSDESFNNDK